MRLFLSSYGISDHADQLHSMTGDNKKLLFIDNAKDYLSEAERTQHVSEKRIDYEALGFEFEELDLRDYFADNRQLAERLDGVGVLLLSGGNTFILRRAMTYSGLDKLIKERISKDDFVFAGSSAGSIVATPSLHGVELADDPQDVPEGYRPEVIWTGLSLIDDHLIPHFESEWDPEMAKGSRDMMDYLDGEGLPYVTLRDGQTYIVDGERYEVLT